MKLSIRIFGFILFMAMGLCSPYTMHAASLTPQQVAQRAASVINASKGLSAEFTMTAGGKSTKGTIKSLGSKFAVSMPQVSTWYNGKSLYTYNPRTSETTVITPTAQELAESNPLLYIKSGGAGFTYKFSTVKRQGKYIIDLLPKNNRSGIKKMTFTVNSSNFHVEKIAVDASSGSTMVTITSFKTGVSLPASDFEYPKSKYPKAEIVDLR